MHPGQVCAGGDDGKDSCFGDSGGPLMYYDRKYSVWVASGITSWGLGKCGTNGFPGVYTSVARYVPWIINSLRP